MIRLLVFVIAALLAYLCVSVQNANAITSLEEVQALNALWIATGGPEGHWNVAWQQAIVCNRPGVACDEDDHVIDLNLENFGLKGQLPDEIGDLKWLHFLSLMNNELEGTFPDSAALLTALVTLNIGGNQLQGPFPSCIRNMTMIQQLFIGPNLFEGVLPDWIGALPLVMFGITGNRFSGHLPDSLGQLVSLVDLYVDDNDFEGGLPESLKQIHGLVNLVVHHNRLSGDIPTWLGDFSLLEWFELDNNNFSGVLPTSIFGELKMLRKIHVGNNPLLHGTLSADMFSASHTQLFSVFVSGTRLTGELPATLATLPALTELRVQDACFVGSLSSDLCPMLPNLVFADFSNDFFECPTPLCFDEYVECVPSPIELPPRCIVDVESSSHISTFSSSSSSHISVGSSSSPFSSSGSYSSEFALSESKTSPHSPRSETTSSMEQETSTPFDEDSSASALSRGLTSCFVSVMTVFAMIVTGIFH